MTFDELVQEVYIITNRPDRVLETKSAIRSATLKAHRTDYYPKDIYETGITFDAPAYRQSLDYPELIANWRALSYLRRAESATDDSGQFFEVLTPREVLDSYGINKENICYVAGRVLEIRSSVQFQYALLGVYVTPIVTEANYSSWVAVEYPFAIVHEAARSVFAALGQLEEARAQGVLRDEEYALLALSSIDAEGR
jgi:hypothetical protein